MFHEAYICVSGGIYLCFGRHIFVFQEAYICVSGGIYLCFRRYFLVYCKYTYSPGRFIFAFLAIANLNIREYVGLICQENTSRILIKVT